MTFVIKCQSFETFEKTNILLSVFGIDDCLGWELGALFEPRGVPWTMSVQVVASSRSEIFIFCNEVVVYEMVGWLFLFEWRDVESSSEKREGGKAG